LDWKSSLAIGLWSGLVQVYLIMVLIAACYHCYTATATLLLSQNCHGLIMIMSHAVLSWIAIQWTFGNGI